MAVRDIFKISRKTFFDPASWLGYETLKTQNRTIWTILKSLFTTRTPTTTETFDEAMTRLGLSEADVETGAKTYRFYAVLFFLLGLVVFLYAFFVLFHYGTFTGWFLGLGAAALFFGYAFCYDFWALQMRKRQLGLTFNDWKQSILGDKRPSP